MVNKVTKTLRNNKKLQFGIIVVVGLLILITGLALFSSLRSKWISGGTNTKGPFSYSLKRGDKIAVKVDVSKLPDGELYVLTPDSEQLQTDDKGIKGKKHCYNINAKKVSYADWKLKLYANEAARKSDDALYWLTISISRDEDGRLTVNNAQASDENAVEYVQNDSYDYQYQVNEMDASILNVQINKPLDNWYIDCDKELFDADDFFYTEEAALCNITCLSDKSFDADISIYTKKISDVGRKKKADEKQLEIVLHVKVKNGSITEVTHE